jgi:hypothetical protein
MTKNKKIKLKEGQELVTVKKFKAVKTKESNNTNPLASELMANWLGNDPDPIGTLNKIKKDGLKKKALSKDNPVKLMKEEMSEEDYTNFWKDLNDLRKYYAIEYFKKGKKIKQDKFPHLYYLPQFIYNYNFKYWKKLITEKRFLEHPEFLVVDIDDIETKEEKTASGAGKAGKAVKAKK